MFKFFSPEETQEMATLMAVALLIVLVAVIVDTITGVMRAIRTKQKIQSSIARRAFGKLLIYYLFIVMLSLIDILLFLIDLEVRISIPELPYLTFFASIGAVATEGWSVWENLPKHDTTSMKNSAKQTQELAKELAKAMSEVRNLAKAESTRSKYFTLEERTTRLTRRRSVTSCALWTTSTASARSSASQSK